jgi:hypothetical protein
MALDRIPESKLFFQYMSDLVSESENSVNRQFQISKEFKLPRIALDFFRVEYLRVPSASVSAGAYDQLLRTYDKPDPIAFREAISMACDYHLAQSREDALGTIFECRDRFT